MATERDLKCIARHVFSMLLRCSFPSVSWCFPPADQWEVETQSNESNPNSIYLVVSNILYFHPYLGK